MNNLDKIAQICGVGFCAIDFCDVVNHPGSDEIKVRGVFSDYRFSKVEWKEEESESGEIKQEFKATGTDMSENLMNVSKGFFKEFGVLVLLKFTNGKKMIVGTDEFPVYVEVSTSGSPQVTTYSFKRSSPERAKEYKSF